MRKMHQVRAWYLTAKVATSKCLVCSCNGIHAVWVLIRPSSHYGKKRLPPQHCTLLELQCGSMKTDRAN